MGAGATTRRFRQAFVLRSEKLSEVVAARVTVERRSPRFAGASKWRRRESNPGPKDF
jgi:hypothetical protein